MGKKIMILGASILQLPAIIKAKEIGLQVIAVDMDPNAVGFQYADIGVNISTLDIKRVTEAARYHQIEGIMTIASDFPLRTIAEVAKELHIKGIDISTALNVTNKVLMRQILNENNIPVPKFHRINTLEEYLQSTKGFLGKYIVKPADNSGSRGVVLVENYQDSEVMEHAFNYSKKYSRSGEIIVEEFMEGPEVSVETLTYENTTTIIAITDKVTTGAPEFVEMGHSIPSQLGEDIKLEIENLVKNAIQALGIKEGPTHTEVIVTKQGPKIVEVGARLGGDNITTHLVPYATGVDMVKACIEIALGNKPTLNQSIKRASAIRYFKTKEGKIKDIMGVDCAKLTPEVRNIVFTKQVGDKISNIESSNDRIGFVITQHEAVKSAIEMCEEALSKIKIVIE
ncbi:ATP-grasp domain-containing protein [Priestia aryabhattai]|uniref:ATP-grasp domain-containing protein n=1 Tax=Priestia aryabhattai TaxID=412384 RepID=UPI003D7FC7C1